MHNPNDNRFYTIPGLFQSVLPPRFNPHGYGATLRFRLPAPDMLGVPMSPMPQCRPNVAFKEEFTRRY